MGGFLCASCVRFARTGCSLSSASASVPGRWSLTTAATSVPVGSSSDLPLTVTTLGTWDVFVAVTTTAVLGLESVTKVVSGGSETDNEVVVVVAVAVVVSLSVEVETELAVSVSVVESVAVTVDGSGVEASLSLSDMVIKDVPTDVLVVLAVVVKAVGDSVTVVCVALVVVWITTTVDIDVASFGDVAVAVIAVMDGLLTDAVVVTVSGSCIDVVVEPAAGGRCLSLLCVTLTMATISRARTITPIAASMGAIHFGFRFFAGRAGRYVAKPGADVCLVRISSIRRR